ncbi:unnamed protein product [Penicillium glandicola]
MSSNRPFLSNFLAAFRAQSTYKATQQVGTTSTLSSAQISQSARTIATKAANSTQGSSAPSSASAAHNHNHNPNHHNHHHTHTSSSTSASTPSTGPVQGPSPTPSHHYHHDQPSLPSTPPSSTSTPIPINRGSADRQRRGSDSSSGSGGFRDAIGPEKWYIGGRTPAGEERFYRLGMVTKGGGRLGGNVGVEWGFPGGVLWGFGLALFPTVNRSGLTPALVLALAIILGLQSDARSDGYLAPPNYDVYACFVFLFSPAFSWSL